MKEDIIFMNRKERERLKIQERLFAPYDKPVYEKLLERPGMTVLDLGSNDGTKVKERFSHIHVAKLIGLESQENLTCLARQNCPGDRFSFYTCDVEDEEFESCLHRYMADEAVRGFDLIHLSFVLMHLKQPERLLEQLQHFLLPQGKLLIVDVDDSQSRVFPDPNGLFERFKQILRADPFSGNRLCGTRIPDILKQIGYSDIVQERDVLRADHTDLAVKEDMFEIFCSYLAEDLVLLISREPENQEYIAAQRWLEQNYEKMHMIIVSQESEFALGFPVITCQKA
ncbi:MAG: methyltransferase domain-containing protein [Lachnospiraceae bacterium]|nr:methyltransferase domain-containing protein [Lachnospiraceae bacterium]